MSTLVTSCFYERVHSLARCGPELFQSGDKRKVHGSPGVPGILTTRALPILLLSLLQARSDRVGKRLPIAGDELDPEMRCQTRIEADRKQVPVPRLPQEHLRECSIVF